MAHADAARHAAIHGEIYLRGRENEAGGRALTADD